MNRAKRGIAGRSFAATLIAVVAMLAASAAQATTYTVNTLADESSTDGTSCSLRDAINAANGSPNSTSSCSTAGTGSDTITFSLTGTITLGGALPTITDKDLTITGPLTSPGITIDGDTTYEPFLVGTSEARDLTLNLNNLTIAHGQEGLGGLGGGLFIHYAMVVNVTNCTFLGNTAERGMGGAIFDFGPPLNVTNSTFSGNSAWRGGAISASGPLNVTNSTFSGNSAGRGGAIAGSANLKGTILAANTDSNCGDSFEIVDKGYNISDDKSCHFTAIGSADYVNPKLGDLANNGGPTMTFALKSHSPAIDAIPQDDCTYLAGPNPCTTSGSITNQLTCDQRGSIRPALGQSNCDIGAVEGVAAPTLGAPGGTCEDDCDAQEVSCIGATSIPYKRCVIRCGYDESCKQSCNDSLRKAFDECFSASAECQMDCPK
jgi:CSLREA domain-containing protein